MDGAKTPSSRSKIQALADEVRAWLSKTSALERMTPPWDKRGVFFKSIPQVFPIDEHSCEIEDSSAPKKAILWRNHRIENDLAVQKRYGAASLRILVSGSGGFIGSELASFLKICGHEVVSLTRSRKGRGDSVYWDPKTAEIDKGDFEGFDAVIHLAGKNIARGFWSKKLKNEIFLSRARDSWLLSQILLRLERPPKTLICASAIGIFGSRGDEALTENSPPGTGFLAEVCKKWEEATSSIEGKGVRGVHTRFGLVLSSKGGMLAKMLPVFRMGLGAILGSGKQYVSWIALDDVVYGIYHALMTSELQGPVNFVAPDPVTNEVFSKKIAEALGKPLFLRIGEKPLRFLLGEMAEEMFLPSVKAYPEKLQASGYPFVYPTLDEALRGCM